MEEPDRVLPGPPHGAPSAPLTLTFVEQFYLLLSIQRVVHVYRGFETAGLRAPYGTDHPSFIADLVKSEESRHTRRLVVVTRTSQQVH